MSKRAIELLGEDFGFYGSFDGAEYETFPVWKRRVADTLLEKGMEYWIVKCNFEAACEKNTQYVKEAKKLLSGKSQAIPLYAKYADVEEWVLVFEISRENIRRLIRIYNAD